MAQIVENICELHSARLAVSTHYLGSCKFCASQWWLWITHFSLMGSYLNCSCKTLYILVFRARDIFDHVREAILVLLQ